VTTPPVPPEAIADAENVIDTWWPHEIFDEGRARAIAVAVLQAALPHLTAAGFYAQGVKAERDRAAASARDDLAAIFEDMVASQFEDAILAMTDAVMARKLPAIEAAIRADERIAIIALAEKHEAEYPDGDDGETCCDADNHKIWKPFADLIRKERS